MRIDREDEGEGKLDQSRKLHPQAHQVAMFDMITKQMGASSLFRVQPWLITYPHPTVTYNFAFTSSHQVSSIIQYK
jgi:hypothetical protein